MTFTLTWCDDDEPFATETSDLPDGFHIVVLPGFAPWATDQPAHIIWGHRGVRHRDRVQSRFAPPAEPAWWITKGEMLAGIPDRERRRRNRAALEARGWAHIV